MLKSYTQQKLEAQRGGDIREIVIESLRQHRGLRNMVMLVSVDLEITDTTLYRWCDELGIDIDEYRRPAVGNVRSYWLSDNRPHSHRCALVTCAGLLVHSWTLYRTCVSVASLTWGGAKADVVPER